ncbi:unnamed protein product [Polarella glacialis]|uniref:Uncharacterized protein n=1 Tax=Polarella glacialis TaxID=89957 RepID=A0A813EF04_POLGL|nr:unnamed protein product [Polarella glacialis]
MRTHAATANVVCFLIDVNTDVQGMALKAGLLQFAMCCVEDNCIAGCYLKREQFPPVVHVIQILMLRAQVSEQFATIQLAISILHSGGLESKTLVCLIFLSLLEFDVSSHFGFRDQIIQGGAISCLQRMLVQHKLPATGPVQVLLTCLVHRMLVQHKLPA